MDIDKVLPTIQLRLKSAKLNMVCPIANEIAPDSLNSGQGDKIILVTRDSHLYILCSIDKGSKVCIADGENILVPPAEGGDDDPKDVAVFKCESQAERKALARVLTGVSTDGPVKLEGQKEIDH